MTADWDAVARTREAVIMGDRINYDSRDDLFFVYGLEGRKVSITRQERFGQPSTQSRGDSLVYDNRTGATELHGPESFQLIAGDTGKRIGTAGSETPTPRRRNPSAATSTSPPAPTRIARDSTAVESREFEDAEFQIRPRFKKSECYKILACSLLCILNFESSVSILSH